MLRLLVSYKDIEKVRELKSTNCLLKTQIFTECSVDFMEFLNLTIAIPIKIYTGANIIYNIINDNIEEKYIFEFIKIYFDILPSDDIYLLFIFENIWRYVADNINEKYQTDTFINILEKLTELNDNQIAERVEYLISKWNLKLLFEKEQYYGKVIHFLLSRNLLKTFKVIDKVYDFKKYFKKTSYFIYTIMKCDETMCEYIHNFLDDEDKIINYIEYDLEIFTLKKILMYHNKNKIELTDECIIRLLNDIYFYYDHKFELIELVLLFFPYILLNDKVHIKYDKIKDIYQKI